MTNVHGTLSTIPAKRKRSIGNDDFAKIVKLHDSQLSLQTLPVVILDNIFEYVSSLDLLKVCCLSKALYWPAVRRIYRTIYTFQSYYPHVKDGLEEWYGSHWQVNWGTAVSEENLDKLELTLQNNQALANCVRGISLYTYTSSKKLNFSTPNLRTYYDSWRAYPPDKATKLRTVWCSALRPPPLTDFLVELNLDADFEERELPYREAANSLIQSNGHSNLKKLSFLLPSYDFTAFQNGSNLSTEVRNKWLCFMDQFCKAGVQLKLESLAIHVATSDCPVKAAALVEKAVDLKNLRTLALNCHDGYPDNPYNPNTSLLEQLTKRTSSLEALVVNTYPIDGLCRALLNNIPHQLKQLLIVMTFFEDEMEGERDIPVGEAFHNRRIVQEAILSSQAKLTHLKISDHFSFRTFNNTIQQAMDELYGNLRHNWYDHTSCECELPFHPVIIHSRPHISAPLARHIEESKEIIHQCLKSDLIYSNSAQNLPNLTQYFIGGLYIDPKERGVLVNGSTILFDPNTAGIFSGYFNQTGFSEEE